MLRKKFAIVVATLIVALIAFVTPLALAATPRQTRQPLNIGVIGPFDGPTAEGVTLALQRFSAQGVFTTPDGASYTLSVITADATTPQQVTDAITELKKNKVIAIFGPNDDALVEKSMSALQAAGIPVFTDATAIAIKGGGLVFRTRAADNWRMAALADYMTADLKKTRFAIYQGDTASGSLANWLACWPAWHRRHRLSSWIKRENRHLLSPYRQYARCGDRQRVSIRRTVSHVEGNCRHFRYPKLPCVASSMAFHRVCVAASMV
jgi:ABC-type sugar transport system substrate-binding protein